MFYKALNKNEDNGIFVAEQNGKIVGFIKIYAKDIEVTKSKNKFLSYIFEFGLYDTIRFAFALFIIESTFIKNDEGYISLIAVSENGRGKGVGTLLIDYGEKVFIESNIHKYTLYVMEENIGAHKLYSKLGFEDKRKLTFPFMKSLIGYSSAIFMVKNI